MKTTHKLFCGHKEHGLWWFRIYGYGLFAANRTIHRPLFSERMGISRTLKLGRWAIETLRPQNAPGAAQINK